MNERVPFRTWGEFKAAVESQGVRDNDPIAYIDLQCSVTAIRNNTRPEEWILE